MRCQDTSFPWQFGHRKCNMLAIRIFMCTGLQPYEIVNDETLLKSTPANGEELDVVGLSPNGASKFRIAAAMENHKVAVSEILRGRDECTRSMVVSHHSPLKLMGKLSAF